MLVLWVMKMLINNNLKERSEKTVVLRLLSLNINYKKTSDGFVLTTGNKHSEIIINDNGEFAVVYFDDDGTKRTLFGWGSFICYTQGLYDGGHFYAEN